VTGSPPATAEAIAALLERSLCGATRVAVDALAPMFGGNARRAVSFEASWREGSVERRMSCVMLSAVAGRHVESDAAAEFRVLRAIEPQGVRAPRALALDEDGSVVGAPSIVLERMPGTAAVVPFLKPADPSVSRALTLDLARVAAGLHAVDPAAVRGWIRRSGHACAAAQLAHWRGVFDAHRLEPQPALESLFGWLDDHLPDPPHACIVHGDMRPGNFLYEGSRVTALLDWEMAHAGDPVEDIAWIYRPVWSPGAFVPIEAFVTAYEACGGGAVTPARLLYWRVFAEVKFACISLTAAHSFATGRTANLRLADRGATVPGCLLDCFDWIDAAR